MQKQNTVSIAGIVALVCVLGQAAAMAGMSSGYTTDGESAALTFGPARGRTTVKSVYATTDKLGGTVKFYSRPTTLSKFTIWNSPANGATEIGIVNTGVVVSNNDHVVYVHYDGTVDYTTVASAEGATNVTLTAGISAAWTNGDALYEITQQGEITVGYYGTGVGTNDALAISGDIYSTAGNSPLRVVADGTTNVTLQVTVER